MSAKKYEQEDLPFEAAELITKFLKDDISDAEMETLHSLLDAETRERILASFQDTPAFEKRLHYMQQLDKKAAWQKVQKKQRSGRMRTLRHRLSYAAAVMLLLSASFYWLRPQKDARIVEDNTYGYKNDLLPGTPQAELILSNGKKVFLKKDSIVLEEEDGTLLSSNKGSLQYSATTEKNDAPVLYNTLRVPEAGTFYLQLPDGTGVYLNAASELTFPTRFSENERRVTLKGEGYFEVKNDALRPFKVVANDNEINVLGTRFNITAYYIQSTVTTLLSGKVSVTANSKKVTLQPGEQAISRPNSLRTALADTEKATAWKDGYFYFSQDPITEIMEQLSRWYGVSVQYEGVVSRSIKYGGSIDRDAKLGEVLAQLKSISNLHFHIDGKELTVSNHEIK